MARELSEIQDNILAAVAANPTLGSKLTSTSHTAIWRLIVYIVAVAIYLHEQIVDANAENSRPHTRRWYREQALRFRYGEALVWKEGQFRYANDEAPTPAAVTHVAITEAANGLLVLKTAVDDQGETVPLSSAVHGKFKAYMKEIKDAGNRLDFINVPADDLKLSMDVWVDPLLYDLTTGESLEEPGTFPVKEACESYLDMVEFNGAYVKTYLIDVLQKTKGVKIPKVISLQHRETNNPSWETITEYVLPYAGHYHYQNIDITYKNYEEVV